VSAGDPTRDGELTPAGLLPEGSPYLIERVTLPRLTATAALDGSERRITSFKMMFTLD